MLRTGALFAAVACLPQARAQSAKAEMLFRNGTVLTMDSARPRAQSVAVSGGKIIGVGPESDLEGLRTPDTKIVDLAGGTLLPGMIDPHMHTVFVAFETWLDVSPFAMKDMVSVVGASRL